MRREPGAHDALVAKAEQILRSGGNPDAVRDEDMWALIRLRHGQD
jgi:hypothetical protein